MSNTAHENPPRKLRTITLTDRPPVRIAEEDWPVIARAADDTPTRHADPYQLERWSLIVRQHADGRTIVYGVHEYPSHGWPGRAPDWRGGIVLELLAGGAPGANQIVDAIRAVGTDGDIPDHAVRACIAGLPAEVL